MVPLVVVLCTIRFLINKIMEEEEDVVFLVDRSIFFLCVCGGVHRVKSFDDHLGVFLFFLLLLREHFFKVFS